MSLKRLSCGLISLVLACSLGYAEAPRVQPPKKQTGADWLLMTPQEKVAYVNSAVSFLRSKGIPINRPPEYYGAMLNTVVDQPGAEKAEVTNLVTTLVYNNEPETRPMINQLRVKPGEKGFKK